MREASTTNMKSAFPLLFLLKISVLSRLIRDLVFWPLKANMTSRKYRPTPFPTLQRAGKTTSLFITTELNILQNFNDRMFKRHHRDAVWGWGPNKYFSLVDRVFTPLCISLRNKENLLSNFSQGPKICKETSPLGTGVFLKMWQQADICLRFSQHHFHSGHSRTIFPSPDHWEAQRNPWQRSSHTCTQLLPLLIMEESEVLSTGEQQRIQKQRQGSMNETIHSVYLLFIF